MKKRLRERQRRYIEGERRTQRERVEERFRGKKDDRMIRKTDCCVRA
jgi:hypothetical protein